MTFLSISATVFGAISALAGLPQVIKIFRRKSAKDISLLTFVLLLLGAFSFLLLGIEMRSPALIIANSIAVISTSLVIIGFLLYNKSE